MNPTSAQPPRCTASATERFEDACARLTQPPGKAQLVGVGGIGMAGLALLLKQLGWSVSGCDLRPGALAASLRKAGIEVFEGHSPAHLASLRGASPDAPSDWIVRSTAVPSTHPELEAARTLELPPLDRGVLLAAILSNRSRSVAVCGSHGKTTTATFTTALLQALGLQPGWCIGGVSEAFPEPAGLAPDAPDAPFVAECDESDGTLAWYHPTVTVVTSVDFDHREHFPDVAAFEAVFERILAQTRKGVVYVREDERAHHLCATRPHTLSVGLHPEAQLHADDIRADASGTGFRLRFEGRTVGTYHVAAPGLHNVRNALAALGAAHHLGVAIEQAAAALPIRSTLPARRFECVAERDGVRVLSDYAHHPAEIRALVDTTRLLHPVRRVAVFQPHRYTRTQALGEAFPGAFEGIDRLALAPVYPASEAPLRGGSTADLYTHFRHAAEQNSAIPVPVLAPSLEAAWHWLQATVRSGDLVLFVGAGDIDALAQRARSTVPLIPAPLDPPALPDVTFQSEVPAGSRTTYGVGGPIRLLADVSRHEALANLLAWRYTRREPWMPLGGGSNLLVPDTGYHGLMIQLAGPAFQSFERDPSDPRRVTVGAGWGGAALLQHLGSQGLGGLEHLYGIPGTLGGWLAMNAGAHGHAILDCIEAVDALDARGRALRLAPSQLGAGYRECRGLHDRIAVAATLRLEASTPAAVAERCRRFARQRTHLAGLRTAGSVFRNPPATSAGRLLDQCGCKGLRVGGAYVTERHANVFATDRYATASDLLALIDITRQRADRPLDLELRIAAVGARVRR